MATTVLIVDDSSFMRMLLRDVVQKNGFTVVGEASNGLDAINLYEFLNPDIVTMDISMPGMNGLDAAKIISQRRVNARIVMVSAIGQTFVAIDAMNVGARGFIVKPFTAEKLIAELEAAMRR